MPWGVCRFFSDSFLDEAAGAGGVTNDDELCYWAFEMFREMN
jgi:hypothetical protein